MAKKAKKPMPPMPKGKAGIMPKGIKGKKKSGDADAALLKKLKV